MGRRLRLHEGKAWIYSCVFILSTAGGHTSLLGFGVPFGSGSLQVGEKAILKCRSDYAYGQNPPPGGKIGPGDTLLFDVELLGFHEKKKERWEMDDDEKVAEADRLKDEGNAAFKANNFHEAVSKYNEAAEYVQFVTSATDLLVACYGNACMALLKLEDWSAALERANKALEKDPNNLKVLYRRGVARGHLGMPEQGLADLERVLNLDPGNKPAQAEIQKLRRQIAAAAKREKAAFSGLFNRASV